MDYADVFRWLVFALEALCKLGERVNDEDGGDCARECARQIVQGTEGLRLVEGEGGETRLVVEHPEVKKDWPRLVESVEVVWKKFNGGSPSS